MRKKRVDEIALREKEKYDALCLLDHDPQAKSPGDLLTPVFIDFFRGSLRKGERVIDFGCGSGRSAIPLLQAGLQVHLIDFCERALNVDIFLKTVGPRATALFTQAAIWDLPKSVKAASWILCFDVLEHIPEEKVDASLKQMARLMGKGGLISISLREDRQGKRFGEVLHLTVKPASWWRAKVEPYFEIQQELLSDGESVVWAIRPLQEICMLSLSKD